MDPFRLAFVLMFAAMFAVRAFWARRARVLEPGVSDPSEGRFTGPVRLFFMPLFTAAMVAWVVRPGFWAFLDLPLPAWLRWGGLVAVYLPGLALLLWVHTTLGLNFSHRLRIRAEHQLVTTGPYRWVRHPMYTAFLLLLTGFALVTANLLFAILPFGAVLAVVLSRTPREDAMLEARFGDEYRAWRARTGALLPRLRQHEHVP